MFDYSGEAETHKQRWERKSKTQKKTILTRANEVITGRSLQKQFLAEESTKPFLPEASSELTPLVRPASLNVLKNGDRAMSGDFEFGGSSRKKKLGLAALTVLIFYEVCGGPFGLEDIVRAGGPFYALVGFVLLLVWSVPEALITAELSTALPEASGSVAWVDCAFGPFWAFQKGWLSWLSGVADNALYPIIFLDCLLKLTNLNAEIESPTEGSDGSGSILNLLNASANGGSDTVRWMFMLSVTIVLTYLNYRGLDVVGTMAIGICVLSMLPFVVFCVVGAFRVQPARWLTVPPGGIQAVDWRLLLNTFFWNINFWDSAASFAGEVENPGVNYPWGMGIAMLLVFLSLFLPVLIGTGASDAPYTDWTDGYFVFLAGDIVGPWLGYWLMFAATITNVGMFEAEMSSDSWQLAGMADRGMLPTVLGQRSKFETPTYGILISATGIVCLCWMTFDQVIDMLNLLYCYGQVIEFLAFLQLRRSRPDIARPFRIGIGFCGACTMLVVPLVFIVVILCLSSTSTLLLSSGMVLLGPVAYWALDAARERKWCHFADRGAFSAYPSFLFEERPTTTTTATAGSYKSFEVDAEARSGLS